MSSLALLGGQPLRTKPFPKWPFASPNDSRRLQEVLESGNWGGYPFPNRLSTEFAARFAEYHGARHACLVTNGTHAITIALRAAGVRAGDEVIVPAYTWDGTATAVLDLGAIPVFADIDPDTYCLDVASARKLVNPRTRAIVPVHLAMRFAGMMALRELAREHDLRIVEDCAHVHGGQYQGEGSGAMGDLGTFSLQSSKLMTAGEGGIVLTSRLEYFELVQTIVNCGRASETDRFGKRITGSNFRMTEFQAAVLLGQLEMLPELAARREHSAARLDQALASMEGMSPLPPQAGITRQPIYCYVFRYHRDAEVPRDLVCAAIEAEGIPCDGRFYEPVYRSDLFRPTAEEFPQLAGIDYRGAYTCPVAERAAYRESMWLPQLVLLDPADVADVIAALEKVTANLGDLRDADPALAGVKSLSRAERPRIERKNY
jgi:dTDP-4-amino-4,6-dideoxygalactose transaminase